MKTLGTLIIVAILAGMGLAGCKTADVLDKTSWKLAAVNDQPVTAETQITIYFEGRQVIGSDGCNNYRTTYALEGNGISINESILSSMIACSDPVKKQAAEYIEALLKSASFQMDEEQLLLLDGNGKTLLVFTK